MPIRRLSQLVFSAAAAAVLSGCATPNANLSTASVGAYRDSIDLTGGLSVNYQKQDGQPERINGRFIWTQRPGQLDVSMVSPLGQTVAEISVTPGAATLTQANRAPQSATDIDALTQKALGYQLPVAGLRDWLQGYATDAQGKRVAASPTNNNVFTRDGWRLRFKEWQKGTAAPMPRVIIAERSANASSGELQIGITIDPAG
jgi:outer membrane lipoprotein LolB